jgi:mannose-P-dolichol utilization defect 1
MVCCYSESNAFNPKFAATTSLFSRQYSLGQSLGVIAKQKSRFSSHPKDTIRCHVVAWGDLDEVEVSKVKASGSEMLARTLGYLMASGAMLIYAPIILKIIKQGNADGFSLQTWMASCLGLSLSVLYPLKKRFPLTSFAELIGAGAQSLAILGILSFYKGKLVQFGVGISALLVLIIGFLRMPNTSPSLLNSIQIAALIVANYSNLPQIIMSFKSKKSSWSWISASMSLIGCLIRVFTTMKLTKDRLILLGYVIGSITNSILLWQVFAYQ